MWFKRSIAANLGQALPKTSKAQGDAAENAALEHLLRQGLLLVARNFKTPGRGGGEVDLIMREQGGTLVFIEVRQRKNNQHGGALASVTATKRRRIVLAAQHFLSRMPRVPPCRFDVVAVEGDVPTLTWVKAAFDAS
jgi:putative endonuclease